MRKSLSALLFLGAGILSAMAFALEWDVPNTTDVVLKYNVYENGALTGSVDAPSVIWTAPSPSPSPGTNFYVTAVFADGESLPSNTVSVPTPTPTPTPAGTPTAPTGLRITP